MHIMYGVMACVFKIMFLFQSTHIDWDNSTDVEYTCHGPTKYSDALVNIHVSHTLIYLLYLCAVFVEQIKT